MMTMTVTTTTTTISGRVGGKLGQFLVAIVLTITELDDDDDEDDDDDDDDFRQSGCGWPAVTFPWGQSADHHRA